MALCLLPKISGVEVTLSITYVESSEQFRCKIHQIWHICKPWSLWSTFLRAMTYHVHKNISDHHHRCLVIIPSRIQCIQEIVIEWSHDIFANLTRVKQKGENMTEEKNTQINALSQTESHLSATRRSNSNYKKKVPFREKFISCHFHNLSWQEKH